jgi:uncharacterized protein
MKDMREGELDCDESQAQRAHAPERRDVHVDFSRCDFGKWHAGGMTAAQFWNAFSLFFPLGEKFFVHSVRPYRRQIEDAVLARDVAAFMGQEAMHSREHYAYVNAMAQRGYPVKSLDVRLFNTNLSEICQERRLATTAAMEHLTSAFSRLVLKNTWVIRGDPDMCKVWFWHAVEELEHKAVVTNVLQLVVPSQMRRYMLRVNTAIRASRNFLPRLLRNHVALLQVSSGSSAFNCWIMVGWYVGVYPGILRRLIPEFLRYLLPGFHPDKQDDRSLLSHSKQNDLVAAIFCQTSSSLIGPTHRDVPRENPVA